MAKLTLLDNEYAKLWYHPDPKIVHHEIRGFAPSALFRELLTTGAACLEREHAAKWLSDDSKNSLVRDEDYAWGDAVWAPRVIRAGFKYWAIVPPAQAVGHLQMRRLCQEYRERGITAELFETVDAALQWLISVDQGAESV